MSAFAAILKTGNDAPAVADVADALAAVTGTAPGILVLGPCAMVMAPLHAGDPPAPVVRPSGVAVAGEILLEGHQQLAAGLGEQAASTAAATIGAAYDAWKDRCTSHLSGEFAFTLWDPSDQALLCARDGLGIRLLYVAESPGAVVVTNVLAAAIRHPGVAGDLDAVALAAFLAHGGAAGDTRTCYRAIQVLPPGHTLRIDAGSPLRARMHRHWHFPLPDGTRRTPGEILEEYRSVLGAAVRDRIDARGTSIFLSGGLDSTTMAAAATEVAPAGTLHAITTRYRRYVEDHELPFTRAAAGHLSLPLTVLDADRHDPWVVDPADAMPAAPLDEPMLADWRDALACAAAHGSAALYGEDGDALLRPPGWSALRQAGSLAQIGVAAARYAISSRRRPYLGLRWRERIGIVPPRRSTAPAWLTAAGRALAEREDRGAVLGQAAEPLPPHPTRPEAQRILTSPTISRTFAATIAPDTTRRRVELRFPILDTRLIQLVVSVPAIPWCQHKTLPRRAYRGRLPSSVLDRPKTPLCGFNEAFVAEWRRGGNRSAAMPASPIDEWVDTAKWRGALEAGEPEAVMAAWRVSLLDAWLAERQRTAARALCIR